MNIWLYSMKISLRSEILKIEQIVTKMLLQVIKIMSHFIGPNNPKIHSLNVMLSNVFI